MHREKLLNRIDEALGTVGSALAAMAGRVVMTIFSLAFILVWLAVRQGRKTFECPHCSSKDIEPFIAEPFFDAMYSRFCCVRHECRACGAYFFLYRSKEPVAHK